jgi:hypothetical protein
LASSFIHWRLFLFFSLSRLPPHPTKQHRQQQARALGRRHRSRRWAGCGRRAAQARRRAARAGGGPERGPSGAAPSAGSGG